MWNQLFDAAYKDIVDSLGARMNCPQQLYHLDK